MEVPGLVPAIDCFLNEGIDNEGKAERALFMQLQRHVPQFLIVGTVQILEDGMALMTAPDEE
ncbi:hypothetical protein [uncultured Roseibium sp.]|uniref:hypothetical protein n=1 Tax=uncultured Roseibium sp. TaxID=1936171 RepID=UPI0032172533